MNRFKGLDLTYRVPKELWTKDYSFLQEVETKIIFKEKTCKKARWLSEKALKIAEKRDAKGKEERERYT